ncbi:hypothetical protein Egran_04232, partial [Elaphomyces granulatus]
DSGRRAGGSGISTSIGSPHPSGRIQPGKDEGLRPVTTVGRDGSMSAAESPLPDSGGSPRGVAGVRPQRQQCPTRASGGGSTTSSSASSSPPRRSTWDRRRGRSWPSWKGWRRIGWPVEPGPPDQLLPSLAQLPRKFLRTMAGFQPDGMGIPTCPGLRSSRRSPSSAMDRSMAGLVPPRSRLPGPGSPGASGSEASSASSPSSARSSSRIRSSFDRSFPGTPCGTTRSSRGRTTRSLLPGCSNAWRAKRPRPNSRPSRPNSRRPGTNSR